MQFQHTYSRANPAKTAPSIAVLSKMSQNRKKMSAPYVPQSAVKYLGEPCDKSTPGHSNIGSFSLAISMARVGPFVKNLAWLSDTFLNWILATLSFNAANTALSRQKFGSNKLFSNFFVFLYSCLRNLGCGRFFSHFNKSQQVSCRRLNSDRIDLRVGALESHLKSAVNAIALLENLVMRRFFFS
jgi:hypothetical protein